MQIDFKAERKMTIRLQSEGQLIANDFCHSANSLRKYLNILIWIAKLSCL